jgi:cytidylate kinase
MIVTIDGPAGSGKSTAARNLARALNIAFLDTGATYRAVTCKMLEEGVDPADDGAVLDVARRAEIRLLGDADGLRVYLDGRDVSARIRTAEVTENAHHVAGRGAVREVLVELQRRIGRSLGDFVTEGRDQGTVVFPEADVKVFLTASPQVRAQRRLAELVAAGERASFEDVLAAIERRDHRDRSREVGPLRCPDDAVVLDTSELDAVQTRRALVEIVERIRCS